MNLSNSHFVTLHCLTFGVIYSCGTVFIEFGKMARVITFSTDKTFNSNTNLSCSNLSVWKVST
uniref:Uncharacterized protein n=1 Tax=Arundo donax TaxID=35708 RepID=A0A0A9D710_ARUDO